MKQQKSPLMGCSLILLALAALAIVVVRVVLPLTRTPPQPNPQPTSGASVLTSGPIQITTPTDLWYALFQRTPFPYTTPLPPAESTILDGPYVKFDPDEPQWWHCRRCEDYIAAGGIWRMHLEKGVYRIFYDVTNWKSLASFELSGDRLYLFNDPNCPDTVGIYTWRQENWEGQLTLTLELVEDDCAIKLRGRNLSKQPWLSCLPPNTEAAISDHWEKPQGCVRE